MPGKELPTIVTVTYNTWGTYTNRLLSTFFQYVTPGEYEEWLMVDNNSGDGAKIANAMTSFPLAHQRKFKLLRSDDNIMDLPQYNRIIPRFVHTEKVICISTDVRIFKETLFLLSSLLDYYDMVGEPGPWLPKGCEDAALGGTWHWIPKLLVDRNLVFQTTQHIQTHCFGIRRSAFIEVGGFWEPEDHNYLDKGNQITGEVYMGTKLVNAKKKLGFAKIPMYHYGNGMKTLKEMERYDRARGWEYEFPVYL